VGWGRCAPVARYPTTSDGGVAILCPLGEALGARLVEHPIAGGAVEQVATRCLGTCLEGTATLAVGLCQVEQQGGTVPADHLGAVDQDLSDSLGVTQESSEAGGGDDGKHRSRLVVGGSLSPRVLIIAGRGSLSRVGGQFPKWHSVAVADAPGAPGARIGGSDATLANRLAVCLLLVQAVGVCLHRHHAGEVFSGEVVGDEHGCRLVT